MPPLLPVRATVLLIISGETGANPLSQLLSIRPLQALGRVSYSWYLWHWPFILLAVAYFERDKRYIRLAAALVALVILVIAALGGFYLASIHLRGDVAKRSLVIIHAGAAIIGFLALLGAVVSTL